MQTERENEIRYEKRNKPNKFKQTQRQCMLTGQLFNNSSSDVQFI
jgi:hypothetical protein